MNLRKFSVIAGLLFLLGIAFSCKGNQDENKDNEIIEVGLEVEKDSVSAMENDLMTTIEGDPDLGTFAMSLNGRNVIDHFRESEGPYTVFAPSNLAYSKMTPENRDEYLGTENDELVNYLVVQALLPPENLKEQIKSNDGEYAFVTMQGEEIVARMVNDSIQLVGARGETAMISGKKKSANGFIYIIDQVLLPKNVGFNSDVND